MMCSSVGACIKQLAVETADTLPLDTLDPIIIMVDGSNEGKHLFSARRKGLSSLLAQTMFVARTPWARLEKRFFIQSSVSINNSEDYSYREQLSVLCSINLCLWRIVALDLHYCHLQCLQSDLKYG